MKMTARSIRETLLPVFPLATLVDNFLFLDMSEPNKPQTYSLVIVFPSLHESNEILLCADDDANQYEYDTETLSMQVDECECDTNITYLLSALLAYSAIERK